MLERDEELLRARLAELADLRAVVKVLEWDMRVTMPSGGAERHGDLLGTMRRIEHERIGADDLGDLLDRAEQSAADEVAADLVRLARRDWHHVRLVPAELAGEIARAGTAGTAAWHRARQADDFSLFAPALARNVELAREYASCFGSRIDHPYDALLANFDHGLTTQAVRQLFDGLTAELPVVIAAAEGAAAGPLEVAADVQRQATSQLLGRLGVDGHTWRFDEGAHPFSSSIGRYDTRLIGRF